MSTGSGSGTRGGSESSAVEDYLEVILQLLDSKGYARVADVADALSFSAASVSNMMRRLDDKGLIKHEKYRGMTLTPEGEQVARRIVKRHGILEQFLALLGVDKQTAHDDVEGMEHHISPGTLLGIEQVVRELKADDAMRKRVRDAASGANTKRP
jgi:Mn-dependent DtxR family transcriptional regulator